MRVPQREKERRDKELAAKAKAAQMMRAKKAREGMIKAKEREMAKRVGQLGVFRALISGSASLQMRLHFTKWVEFVEMARDERQEVGGGTGGPKRRYEAGLVVVVCAE